MSPREALDLQATLQQTLRRLKARHCLRPVLRGRAVAGRPDPLIVDLVEARGRFRGCATWIAQHRAAVRQRLFSGGAIPGIHTATAPGDLTGLQAACGGVPEALSRVVRFGDVCSPYRPGLRPLPDFLPGVRVQHGAAALAVTEARRDGVEAAWRLLEILRFGQDLERGGTPWIWPYVQRSAWRPVVAALGRWIAFSAPGAKPQPALYRALRTLLASEPTPASHLHGERLYVEWTTYLTPWARRTARAATRSYIQAEQGHLLAWMAYRGMALRFQRACPPTVVPRRCYHRFQGLAREGQAASRHLKDQWAWFEDWLAAGHLRGKQGAFDRRAARKAALAVLAGHHPTRHDQHLLRAAQRGFYLTALRLHLAVRRAQAAQVGPLRLSQVEALARRFPEPFSGAPVEASGQAGHVLLQPSIALAPAGEPPVRYVMRWKARRPDRR